MNGLRLLVHLGLVLAWIALLACLPWWLGVAIWLACLIGVVVAAHKQAGYGVIGRRALECGLLGLLFAAQRAMGGGLPAWIVALLGGLSGFTLMTGLLAWLDRASRRAPIVPAAGAEWPELALAPIGPADTLIELLPPTWQMPGAGLEDSRGGKLTHHDDGYHFADGRRIAGAGACCFSPDGQWFVAATDDSFRSFWLWDREQDRVHHLRGWLLCGWHAGQPWLSRHARAMPRPWHELASTRPTWRT